ncbi:MAG: hypothetical protein MR762_11880 [Clostridiales bacterium]|nr:hypothetical protein [Clostridiales bacterium]
MKSTNISFVSAIATVAGCLVTVISLLPVLLLATAFAAFVTWFCCALLLPANYVLPVTATITMLVLVGSALYGWYTTP